MNKKVLLLFVTVLFSVTGATAQSEIYPQHFNLEEVTLTTGPLKTAMDKNIEMLLQYDVDRLLTPYIRQAGLNTGDYEGWVAAHPSFSNWGSYDFNLDGHVGGHYLTALSLAYAACHDATTKTALKTRLDKMVSVMKDCQDAFDGNTEGLEGFIGGQPMNDAWKRLYSSQDIGLAGTGSCAVPWYCQHKILAGLRDAYVYGGNETARTVFLKLCDWCILVTSTLSDEQMEWMLNTEHGGVNETLLDAYKLTEDTKYLTAAKRFTHKAMLDGLQSLNTTFLDNKHANTQVPKYIGMERIFEEDATATAYQAAAENFWTDVAQNRTVCIGGNSMYEHFLAAGNSAQYINHLDGPESCNTNNMLKLSEMLSDRTHDARYADFYEYAMWNHILSTQDPTTGGYVYFTTLRPQGYRIYSTVNESMWCCVGTGMENHSKYGHFIYTHDGTSTLYVNLFTPSTLSSDDFSITQATSFPFSDETTLTVGKAGTYTIAIRHPWWTTAGYKIYINDEEQSISVTAGTASYVSLNRTWTAGDVIRVVVPMQLRYTPCPNYTDYIAFQYGPILLAAQTSTNDAEEASNNHLLYEATLQNEYGHEGRMDHAPGSMARKLSLTSAPLLIGDRDGEDGVLTKISTTDRSTLTFNIDASRDVAADVYTWQSLTLQPFYQIHHARYSCYWYQATAEDYANSSMAADEAEAAALADRTLDFVATGEQQSEAGHFTSYENSTTGVYRDEYYRDARPTNGYVQYTLSYQGEPIESGLSVLCRFTNDDHGRKATLYVDGEPIANIMTVSGFNGANESGFYNVEYPIPASLMRDAGGNLKQSFVVRLAADKGTNAPGLYYLRLMKGYTPAELPATITTTAGDERTVVDGVVTGENGQDEMVHEFAYTVSNTHGISAKYWRNATSGGTYSYNLSTGGNTEGVSLVVEMYGNDADRVANIDIDGVTIAVQEINYLRNNYIILEYPIDPVLLQGKTKVNVKFSSIDNKYTPGTNIVYLITERPTAARVKTPYTFVNENFEKNGNDGNISSMTYNDGAIQIASDGGDYKLNMRMKTSMKDTYSIMPSQYLFTVKGQNLGTKAYLWWMMGCNHGAQDAPTYTYSDGDDQYLIWDLRKVATFNDAEKNTRFFGVSETPLTTTHAGAYSLLCMGLTSTADDHSATISDINFYSPEELVDKYSVLSSTVKSLKTGLATDSVFAYGDYAYKVADASTLKLTKMLSTGTSVDNAPSTLFGYNVAKVIPSSYYSEPAEGTFYLYNVTQDKFLTGAPSMSQEPAAMTLAVVDGSLYSIQSGNYLKMGHYNGQFLWNNGWTDNEYFKWTFSSTSEHKYHLNIHVFSEKNDNGYTFEANTDYYLNTVNSVTTTAAEADEWALITAENYTSFLSSVAGRKHTIIAANGDATSLVTNPSFEDSDVSAWTGGVRKTGINSWRGNGLCDYENTDGSDAIFSQVISNMPAGTYKVVAVVRGAKGTMATASINGTSGATITNTEFTDNIQINYNGVQMPKPTFTSAGFNTTTYALGWKWATATYTLADDGDLTISFTMNGSGFRGIDDVHLYYMSDGKNSYALEYSDGVNNTGHVVTCDLITDNPNKVWISASDITTAASAVLKNNFPTTSGWQGFYWVNSLVLYDGYEFTPPTDKTFKAVNSTLYRNITAESFATICCPFQITGSADGTFYQPANLTDGTLNFETVDTKVAGKAYLYKASSAVTALTGPTDALLATSPVDNGEGVVMKGRYLNMEEVPYDDYVLNGTNLYKVNSIVTLKPFRAYFTIPGGNSNARITLNFDDETTGINVLETESTNDNASMKDGKYFQNGKIVIVKNGVKYATNGQIVK